MRWWKTVLCIAMGIFILSVVWRLADEFLPLLADANPQDARLGLCLIVFAIACAVSAFFFLTGELKLMKQEWARRGQLVSFVGISLVWFVMLLTFLAIPAFAAGEIGAGLFLTLLSVLIPWAALSTIGARLGIVFPKWKKRGAKQRDPAGQASSVQRPARTKPLTVDHEERAAVRPDQASSVQRPVRTKPLTVDHEERAAVRPDQASSVQQPVRTKPLTVDHEERAAVRPDQASSVQQPARTKPLPVYRAERTRAQSDHTAPAEQQPARTKSLPFGRAVRTVWIPEECFTMRLNYQFDRSTREESIIDLQMTPSGCYLDMTDIQGKAVGGDRVLLPETFLRQPIHTFLDGVDAILKENYFDPLDRTQVDMDALRLFLDTPAHRIGKPRTEVQWNGKQAFEGVIENGVLTEYTGTGGVVEIPEGVTAVGDGAFEGSSGPTVVVIPEGVTHIGASAFRNCKILRSVVLPKSLLSIGAYAFMNCPQLQRPKIPGGVEIGKMAFSGVNKASGGSGSVKTNKVSFAIDKRRFLAERAEISNVCFTRKSDGWYLEWTEFYRSSANGGDVYDNSKKLPKDFFARKTMGELLNDIDRVMGSTRLPRECFDYEALQEVLDCFAAL